MNLRFLLGIVGLFATVAVTPRSWAASDVTLGPAVTAGGSFSGGNPNVFSPTDAVATANVTAIQTALNANTAVTITTASAAASPGDLTLAAPLSKTTAGATALTLAATRNLILTGNLNAATGSLGLSLSAGGAITQAGSISTNGGALTLAPTQTFTAGNSINAGSGAISLSSGTLVSASFVSVTSSAGVNVAAPAALRLVGTVSGPLTIAGSVSPGATGSTATLQVSGPLTLLGTANTSIEIGGTNAGTSFDRISATGAVTLAGALQISLVNNFHDTITSSQTFTVIQGASLIGTFSGYAHGSRYTLADGMGSLRINYSATAVTLDDWQPVITDLTWDPGLAEAGTAVATFTSTRAGRHYYRVTTQATDIGAWRTRLTLSAGDAALYLGTTSLPTPLSHSFGSAQDGSDGVVLREDQYTMGTTWFLLVHAAMPGAQWSLTSGRAFVHDLGALPFTDANSNAVYDLGEAVGAQTVPATPMPPEGIRFYKATPPPGTPAWSLWLLGSSREIALRTGKVPFPAANQHTRKQAGQMLVVPNVLGAGGGTYFLSVSAPAGEVIGLDSRIQLVEDLAFSATTPALTVDAAPYRVFRVIVPVDQIAWDLAVTPGAGNPNLAVRRAAVPGEWDNDAVSEAAAGVIDSVTLVPGFLTNGVWYVTVYGNAPYGFTLRSGNPTISPLAFNDLKVNDQTTRAGWRYYSLTDIAAQIGSLGWELLLANQVPGTSIALRRNQVPSRWSSRTNGSTVLNDTGNTYMDFGSSGGFLQRPGHQADVWFVGIYTPAQPLGAFSLDVHPILPGSLGFNAALTSVANQPPGHWLYHQVTVPAGALGWDLRVKSISGGGAPVLVVRRDQLPASTNTTFSGPWSTGPSNSLTWPSGHHWVGATDWTGRTLDAVGSFAFNSQRLLLATGRPLEPGTYFVGVFNSSASAATSYTLESRGIGPGLALPVTDLALVGGSAAISGLAPREAAYFKVTIPAATPSWIFTLTPSPGEALLAVRRTALPDFSSSGSGSLQSVSSSANYAVKIQRAGAERFTLLPVNNQDFLLPGDYYLAVVSEGDTPADSNRVGPGPIAATLTSVGPLPVTALGEASAAGLTQPVSLAGGELAAYQFTVPDGTPSLEIRLDNRVGNPTFSLVAGSRLPAPFATSNLASYGFESGQITGTLNADSLLTVANPAPGLYSLVVRASGVAGNTTSIPSASADLVVVANSPAPLSFNAASAIITGQPASAWRYFQVTVPAGTLGWDLRIKSVTGTGTPVLAVRRDQLPAMTGISYIGAWASAGPWAASTWPSGNHWAGALDWTGRSLDPIGSFAFNNQRLLMATGRPLEPGTYFVGVFNSSASAATSYTLESRGIGPGLAVPVTDLALVGGSAAISGLAPREAAYFKVTIPAGTPSWTFTLTPLIGEALLVARRTALPDFSSSSNGSLQTASSLANYAVKVQRAGAERFALLPVNNQDFLLPGDYYLAVVSEGDTPADTSRVGPGPISATLTSVGPLPVTALGDASAAGLTQPVALAGGELAAYQFTVPAGTPSLEVRLDNRVGNPTFSLVAGSRLPAPFATSNLASYGFESGQITGTLNADSLLTVANPAPGLYSVVVRASGVAGNTTSLPSASADLVVVANSSASLGFDATDSSVTVTGQPASAWRYFQVTVPANTLGWDLRIKSITGGGTPVLVVRRDQLPANTTTSFVGTWGVAGPWSSTTWPSGNQWVGTLDWTGRSFDPIGSFGFNNQRLLMATGRPLEPGTYFVGVFNSSASAATSYTLESRGIGPGLAVPVTDLALVGGSAVISSLAPREAAYFKVTIPAATPSWTFTLTPSLGEALLVARRTALPDFSSSSNGSLQAVSSLANYAVKVQRAGAERFVLLPVNNQDFLLPGDYYLAVVSEGDTPADGNRVGPGPISATLTSVGPLPVTALGAASIAGLTQPVALAGGELVAYQFTVPVGTPSLEVRLDNRVGNPTFSLVAGPRLPAPYATSSLASYGYESGQVLGTLNADSLLTLANPTPGLYSLVVRASGMASSGTSLPSASANLVIRQLPRLPLSYAESLNASNGLSHLSTRQLIDGQKDFYEVAVPATLAGQPVLGWLLNIAHLQGDTTLRLHRTWGNTDNAGITVTGNSALLVPPFLTPGSTWYIEVTATGQTHYTLTSRPITLERPVWSLPLGHNTTFGDSGNDALGFPLPGDRGIDLGQDDWHFFAVDVPAGNSGLLRTELQVMNGNPNLYLREDGVPTIDHDSNGNLGGGLNLAPRSLTDTASEYGNWVPLDGRTEKQLAPGRWFLGVRATGGSNARYRLLVSNGQVTDLALAGGSVASQNLTGRDWRYYRFTVPADAPLTWNLTFSQTLGDAVLYLRDTVPPGIGPNPTTYEDWSTDAKNQPVPAGGGIDPEGTYAFTTPILRPGHTYYVGMRAKLDSTFSLSSAVAGGSLGLLPTLDYTNGVINQTLAANGTALFRIPVPTAATRLKWTSTLPATVQVRLEQGTPPAISGATQHHVSSGANPALNQPLTATGWPWQTDQIYYLRLVNTAGTPASVTLTLAGVTAATEDEDGDGLPDAWELAYFPSIFSHNGASDPDLDGVTNVVEFIDGTVPNDLNSALYFLAVASNGGSVLRAPDLPKYPRGTVVTLTATPPASSSFIGWSGTTGSLANPWALTMLANHSVGPVFGIPLATALDTPALVWTPGGSALWRGQGFVTHDGVDAAQSGSIGDNQQSWMETTVTGPGTLTYRWKVSSQAGGDFLEFALNGALQAGRISGEVDWTLRTHSVPAGVHTLRWTYVKNFSALAGSDAAWVDEVAFTVTDPYNAWAATFFSPSQLADPLISGHQADPDGDGSVNLLEYALGGSPLVKEASANGQLVRLAPDSWVFRYTRPAGRAGLTYGVESTANLGATPILWTAHAQGVVGTAAGIETVEAPVPTPANVRIARLVITYTP